MKKTKWLTTGAVSIVIVPIATVISCSTAPKDVTSNVDLSTGDGLMIYNTLRDTPFITEIFEIIAKDGNYKISGKGVSDTNVSFRFITEFEIIENKIYKMLFTKTIYYPLTRTWGDPIDSIIYPTFDDADEIPNITSSIVGVIEELKPFAGEVEMSQDVLDKIGKYELITIKKYLDGLPLQNLVRVLPSTVTEVTSENLLENIFQITEIPPKLAGLTFENILIKPNDKTGHLEISFDIKKALTTLNYSKIFTNYSKQDDLDEWDIWRQNGISVVVTQPLVASSAKYIKYDKNIDMSLRDDTTSYTSLFSINPLESLEEFEGMTIDRVWVTKGHNIQLDPWPTRHVQYDPINGPIFSGDDNWISLTLPLSVELGVTITNKNVTKTINVYVVGWIPYQ